VCHFAVLRDAQRGVVLEAAEQIYLRGSSAFFDPPKHAPRGTETRCSSRRRGTFHRTDPVPDSSQRSHRGEDSSRLGRGLGMAPRGPGSMVLSVLVHLAACCARGSYAEFVTPAQVRIALESMDWEPFSGVPDSLGAALAWCAQAERSGRNCRIREGKGLFVAFRALIKERSSLARATSKASDALASCRPKRSRSVRQHRSGLTACRGSWLFVCVPAMTPSGVLPRGRGDWITLPLTRREPGPPASARRGRSRAGSAGCCRLPSAARAANLRGPRACAPE